MTPNDMQEAELLDRQQEPSEEEIAALAHEMWVARGCPEGTPEEDWFRALDDIRNRKTTTAAAG